MGCGNDTINHFAGVSNTQFETYLLDLQGSQLRRVDLPTVEVWVHR